MLRSKKLRRKELAAIFTEQLLPPYSSVHVYMFILSTHIIPRFALPLPDDFMQKYYSYTDIWTKHIEVNVRMATKLFPRIGGGVFPKLTTGSCRLHASSVHRQVSMSLESSVHLPGAISFPSVFTPAAIFLK